MAGKRYSAGAIFLQVVPVFANVQRAIEDEAKNIDRALGGQMEKSGQKAGERAGKAATKAMKKEVDEGARELSGSFEREFHKSVDDINRALGGINIKRLSNDMRREVTEIKKELSGLKDVDITGEADFKRVYAEMAVLEGRLRGFRDETKIVFRSDIDQALKGFAKVAAAKESIDDPVEIEVRVDSGPAERQLTLFEKKFRKTTSAAAEHLRTSSSKAVKDIAADLKSLEDLRIGIDISSGRALAELAEVQVAMEKMLNDQDVDIDVKVELAAALADLAALSAIIDKIEADDIDIKAKVDSDGLRSAARHGEDAANSFRSFNVILLAVVSAGPALIPILAGIAGGLIALGPASAVAVGGLGSVLVGFSGIGDALTALGNQQDQAAMTAQSAAKSQVSSARAIENAQEALSDARRNAARAAEDAADRVKEAREAAADAIEEALKRQKQAQEDYRDAVEDVQDAEQALRDAREEARKDAETLAKRQRQNAVDERQAVLDLGEAQAAYNAVMADTGATSTEREQASISLEQAQIALNDTRDEQVALSEEAADYAKNGVDGSEKVKDAQDDLTAALEAQKDAQEAVKEAAEAADEARIEGAKRVKEALEAQRETLSDNARAIQRAKENLSDARQQAEEDLGAINSQAQAVEAAFDKLGPAGRKFALFLFSLRSGFYEFRDAIQQVLLPAIQEAIEGFIGSENATKAKSAFVALAESFGQFAKALSQSFQGPVWGAFFEMLATLGPKIQAAYGQAFIKVMEAFASILTTTAPFALEFAEGLAKMMGAFAKWAESKEGQEAIQAFLDHVREIGPKVLDFFSGLIGAAIAVAKALSPLGDVVLGMIDNFLKFISMMDSDILGAILTGLTVILLASQVVYAVQNLAKAGAAIFATTMGPWIFLVIALGAALVYLYKTNEDFAKFIDKAWGKISKIWDAAWKKYIKPALTELKDALVDLWDQVLEPFFKWLGPILLWAIERMLPNLLIMFSVVVRGIARWIEYTLIPGFKMFGGWMKWLWERAIDLRDEMRRQWEAVKADARSLRDRVVWFFQRIAAGWQSFADDMRTVYDNTIGAMWDYITDTALPALQSGFETTINAIGDLWDGLRRLIGTPIKFVIERIINDGLIAGFNNVSDWVDGPHIDPLPVPQWMQSYATGGIMPGYTPGRDPHKFYSPTGGRLELSGGEAVMRPEWTAAMGADYVNTMNALARRGGVKAVRQAAYGLGGYWMGGVLPLPGGSVSSHGSAYGHPAFDLNYPGYSDYGKPVKAWRSGRVAQKNYIGDNSYGRWVVLNHPGSQSSLYAHLSDFAKIIVGQAIGAGQTIGYVGDIGNTGTPPTSHLHFEIQGGNVDYSDNSAGAVGSDSAPKMPEWLSGIVSKPIAWAKNLIAQPLEAFREKFSGNKFAEAIAGVPGKLAKAVGKYAKETLPTAWKGLGNKLLGNPDHTGQNPQAPGPESGIPGQQSGGNSPAFAAAMGGILPYNGTMMYDSGGYLPPGMTTVMNLTGKPEPVFTSDQFDQMGGGLGGGFTYAPTFHESNLKAADVTDDLQFASRAILRRGRYDRSQL